MEQTEELTAVVSDLIALARGDQRHDDIEDLDLADIARAALARAERHAPQLRYEVDIQPWPMSGSRERLGRASTTCWTTRRSLARPAPPCTFGCATEC